MMLIGGDEPLAPGASAAPRCHPAAATPSTCCATARASAGRCSTASTCT
jgi:hypothetical protein